MAQKRNLNDFLESEASSPVQAGKIAKITVPSIPPDSSMEMSQSELEALSHGDLVAHAFYLQQALQKIITLLESEQNKNKTLMKEASKKSALAPKSANNVAAAQTMSPEQVTERAKKLAEMCAKGIKKQMKWQ
ncbi:hypothetical protein MMC07_000822, partial [Pseudocyphellaria aurata]|nr:hypothetical protein [Pseudocyphellaria aurata]